MGEMCDLCELAFPRVSLAFGRALSGPRGRATVAAVVAPDQPSDSMIAIASCGPSGAIKRSLDLRSPHTRPPLCLRGVAASGLSDVYGRDARSTFET